MKPKIENKHHIKETKTAWRKGASQSAPKFPICQNDDTNQSLTKVFGSRNLTTPEILCLLEATFFVSQLTASCRANSEQISCHGSGR